MKTRIITARVSENFYNQIIAESIEKEKPVSAVIREKLYSSEAWKVYAKAEERIVGELIKLLGELTKLLVKTVELLLLERGNQQEKVGR